MDKFYTKIPIALKCIETVGLNYNWTDWDLVIEPSAGNGNFLSQIPHANKLGFDIAPEGLGIIEQDFLTFPWNEYDARANDILILGNPPFGKVSSKAIQFFNHAAACPKVRVIAFILPRTFRRKSVQNKLDLNFYLKSDEDIPVRPCAFDPPMAAKCCFQIWERRGKGDAMRAPIVLSTSHPDWEFLKLGPIDERNQPTPPLGADFAIRAYGGKCGEICEEHLERLRPKSWHWIRCTRIEKEELIRRFNELDYRTSLDTARQNSIGKGELVELYQIQFGNIQ